jgi:hypothetical protein
MTTILQALRAAWDDNDVLEFERLMNRHGGVVLRTLEAVEAGCLNCDFEDDPDCGEYGCPLNAARDWLHPLIEEVPE